jgi:GxxExxY protein
LKDCDEHLIATVLTAATNVHRELGPGLLESVYELALMVELADLGIEAKRQVEIPVNYRGRDLGIGFRADIIVGDSLLLEIKAIEDFNSTHLAQIMTYMKLLGLKRGFLLNFHKKLLKDGIKRVSL